jgi:hypothetical protein
METATNLKFADGEYRFWLAWPQVLELERTCGFTMPDGSRRSKSVFEMFRELDNCFGVDNEGYPAFTGFGNANALDIRETIRLGLIGGGEGMVGGEMVSVSPLKANQLIADYTYPARPMNECLGLAWAILYAAISGIQVKKKEPETVKPSKKRSAKAI